ncbi:MAG: DUF5668 domain-containing protein [Anaerolineales bacterium]
MEEERKHPRRGSYFGPILLIVIGVIFLAHNLGLIPGQGWEMLVKMWPALLIIAGLDELIRRQGIAWPVLLVGAGTFLLLNNFGPRTYVTWTKIVQLWPLILIAFGIDLLFRSRTWWGIAISIVLVLMIVGGAVMWIGFEGSIPPGASYPVEKALSPEVQKADIRYQLGAGQLIVGELSGEDMLIAGTAYPEKPDETYSASGGIARYSLEVGFPAFYPNTTQWELGLLTSLPVSLHVENGAGELFLALERVELEMLSVEQGVGDIVVRLPQGVEGEVSIDQAVGRIQILVPEETGIKVHFDKAISRLDVPEAYQLEGHTYTSPGFEEMSERITIHLEQAIGYMVIQVVD